MISEPLADSLAPWSQWIKLFYVAVTAAEDCDVEVCVHVFVDVATPWNDVNEIAADALQGVGAEFGGLFQAAADEPHIGHVDAKFSVEMHYA